VDCSNVDLKTFSSNEPINEIVAESKTRSLIHSRTPFTTRAKTKRNPRDKRNDMLWLFITGPKTVLIYTIGATGKYATNIERNIAVMM
jgi:hypothetical protein